MLTRHHGLLIFLLFAVAGHASLSDRLLGRVPPWQQLGFALLLAPILLVLLGEWIANDSLSIEWQRRGWGLAVFGASWHLLLDFACLLLPWLGVAEWRFGLAGATVGGVVMALVLRRALAGFADPEADPADPAQSAAGESTLQRAGRELSLVGGTAIAVTLICLGFVLLAAFGMIRRPERITLSLLGAAAFFGLGALIGVWMGLDRRAMLLGQRAPLSRLRPRWTRAGRAVATREGLALLDRKGATLYGWAAIAEISVGELYGNSALMVRLLEGALPLRVAAPGRSQVPSDGSRWARREARARAVQRALSGCDLAILGTMTDEGAGVLCRELSLAFADRAERCQLPTVEAALATHFLPPQRA